LFFLHYLESITEILIEIGILLFETVGVIILLIAGVRAVHGYFKKGPHTSVTLARGMAMALQFKMGAEILRTVQIRQMQDLYLVAGIVVIRIVLTLMTHYEIKEGDQHRIEEVEAAMEAEANANAAADSAEL